MLLFASRTFGEESPPSEGWSLEPDLGGLFIQGIVLPKCIGECVGTGGLKHVAILPSFKTLLNTGTQFLNSTDKNYIVFPNGEGIIFTGKTSGFGRTNQPWQHWFVNLELTLIHQTKRSFEMY